MQTIPAWGRSLWMRAGQPTPVFLPGEFHEQRAWWAVVHWVPKSQIWPQVTEHTHMQICNYFRRNTEPRTQGKEKGFGYFKVWNQLNKCSSCGKTPCVSQWAEHLKKEQAYTPDANHEAFPPLKLQGCELSQAKQGLPRDTEGKPRDIPNQITTSQGSDPHPQTAGSCRSPPSRPGTRPSEQDPGTPTPLEWTWGPHAQQSTVSEMKAHFTNRCRGGFLFLHKRRISERDKDQVSASNILIDLLKAIWNTLLVSNFLFSLKTMIYSNQHELVICVDNTWKTYKWHSTMSCPCKRVTFYAWSDI